MRKRIFPHLIPHTITIVEIVIETVHGIIVRIDFEFSCTLGQCPNALNETSKGIKSVMQRISSHSHRVYGRRSHQRITMNPLIFLWLLLLLLFCCIVCVLGPGLMPLYSLSKYWFDIGLTMFIQNCLYGTVSDGSTNIVESQIRICQHCPFLPNFIHCRPITVVLPTPTHSDE